MARVKKGVYVSQLRTGESRRKNGTYEYRYYFNGKRHSIYAKTLKALREKERSIDYSSLNANNITISEMLDRYYSLKRNLRGSTRESYEAIIRQLKSHFGEVLLKNIKAYDVKKWFVELQDNGLKYSTIEQYKSLLRLACDSAIEDELATKNVFKFKMSFLKNDKKVVRALTVEETEELLTYLKKNYVDYYYITLFYLETGVRMGEGLGIQFKDINLTDSTVTINKQLMHIRNVAHICPPKTKSGYRTIPLSNKAKECVVYFFSHRNPRAKAVDGYDNFLLNRSRWTLEKFYMKINQLFPFDVHCHVFRHTYCSRLVAKDVNPKALQYLMGHSDIQTTLNVYATLTSKDVSKLVENIV